jgi:RHS repeat-associated protein
VGVSYDANGNQGDSGSGIYSGNTYSMENQLIWQVEGGDPYPANVYAYDPWGKRVLSGSDPDPLYAPQPNYTYTFYGITGQALASANCSGYPNPSSCWVTGQNVYYGRKLIVSGGVSVVTDRLGSVRSNTQGASFAYYPYGEERTSTVNGLDKFATYFRDAVGQDYADQRYYNASVGRFWSPDPTMDNVDYTNSASWNAYAYVNGDPINFNDPNGLSVVTLPPVVPGVNCSTVFIDYAGSIGMTIQQLFDSDMGILGVMSYFEQEGGGDMIDQEVWAALDWTFLNQWSLSAADKAWFYGPKNIPASFAATVTTGSSRSQVFTSSGQLTPGFTTDLLNILTGPPDSSQCEGLVEAFMVAQGAINAYHDQYVPGELFIIDPVPGALQFGSDGARPRHGRYVVQTQIDTIVDSPNTWNFYSDVYMPPPPVRRPPRRRPRGEPQ